MSTSYFLRHVQRVLVFFYATKNTKKTNEDLDVFVFLFWLWKMWQSGGPEFQLFVINNNKKNLIFILFF